MENARFWNILSENGDFRNFESRFDMTYLFDMMKNHRFSAGFENFLIGNEMRVNQPCIFTVQLIW